MAAKKPKKIGPGRSLVSDMTLTLSVVSVSGRLVNVLAPNAEKDVQFTSICPDVSHEAPERVFQQYRCEHDHGPWGVADLAKAKEQEDGTLVRVTKADIEAAKASDLPENVLNLTVHPRNEVEGSTYPTRFAYVFYPKALLPQYGLLLDLVAEPDLAFIGQCNLRGTEKLLRLERWGDNLVVRALWYPEYLNEREAIEVDYDSALLTEFLPLIESRVESFDPEKYQNGVRERILALTGEANAAVAEAAAPKAETDLLAAMKALKEQA